jgi:hypothetical protein
VVSPRRIADSRLRGAPFGRIGSGATATMDFTRWVSGTATSAVYNLTATNTVAGGYITAFPTGRPRPLASSVNWSGPAQNRATLTVSSLASARRVSLFAFTATDAVLDLAGWFTR